MQVLILSKTEFDELMVKYSLYDNNIKEEISSCMISIIDTEAGAPEPHFQQDHKNVKVVRFDDVEMDFEYEVGSQLRKAHACTKTQAQEIYDFIKENEGKDLYIVHCAAGISRSGAVGTFINDFYKGDRDKFIRQNPYIHPNGLVLSLLNRIAREDDGLY